MATTKIKIYDYINDSCIESKTLNGYKYSPNYSHFNLISSSI